MRFASFCLLIASLVVSPVANSQTTAGDVSFDDSTTTVLQGPTVQDALEDADTAVADLESFHSGVAAAPSVVRLQLDCTGYADCFESLADLQSFIWSGGSPLNPTAASPLLVDIGPGDFPGHISCPADGGHVTFRGSGRDHTRLTGPSVGTFIFAKVTVVALGCENLGFQDMRIESSEIAVYWVLEGSSTWTDVDIAAPQYGWYDTLCGGEAADPPAGVHYFFGSRVESSQVGFFGNCGETWFYGSEIMARPTAAAGSPTALLISGRADVRVFGGTVRVVTADATSGTNGTASGVVVGAGPGGYQAGGTLHFHGGIVSVDASAIAGMDARGLWVGTGPGSPAAHTPDTAFALRPGTGGSAIRVQGGGAIASPFLWPSGDQPPLSAAGSLSGKDLFVETDCGASGCSGGSDSHLMVYQENCVATSGTPWFDIVTGACRVP